MQGEKKNFARSAGKSKKTKNKARSYLSSIVVRDGRTNVVSDVSSSNAVVKLVDDPRVRSVDGQQGTLSPSPRFSVVVRNIDVGVLQPGVANQPSVGDEVREAVLSEDGDETFSEGPSVKGIEYEDNSNVA